MLLSAMTWGPCTVKTTALQIKIAVKRILKRLHKCKAGHDGQCRSASVMAPSTKQATLVWCCYGLESGAPCCLLLLNFLPGQGSPPVQERIQHYILDCSEDASHTLKHNDLCTVRFCNTWHMAQALPVLWQSFRMS